MAINEDMMNELVLANRATNWQKLKSLVLGQRLLPDHEARICPRAGRILRVVWPGATTWLQQGDCNRRGEARGLGSVSINVRITAVRKPAAEAVDSLLAPELAAGIARLKSAKAKGRRCHSARVATPQSCP